MSTNNLSTLCAIPWDTDSIHLQGITEVPLACLFRCHFCAVGGFQQAAGSPVSLQNIDVVYNRAIWHDETLTTLEPAKNIHSSMKNS